MSIKIVRKATRADHAEMPCKFDEVLWRGVLMCYKSDCGHVISPTIDRGIYKFCPYCGGKIKVKNE